MNKIQKYLPHSGFIALAWLSIGLLVALNNGMASIMGDDEVKFNGECAISTYEAKTNDGVVTCGEFTKVGSTLTKQFVGLVYLQSRPVYCKIIVEQYSDDTDWKCKFSKPEE